MGYYTNGRCLDCFNPNLLLSYEVESMKIYVSHEPPLKFSQEDYRSSRYRCTTTQFLRHCQSIEGSSWRKIARPKRTMMMEVPVTATEIPCPARKSIVQQTDLSCVFTTLV